MNARALVCIGLIVLGGLSALVAQTPATDKPPVSAQKLSDLEQLKLDNISLKSQLVDILKQNSALQAQSGKCQEQLGPLQSKEYGSAVKQELDTLKTDVEKAHPGFEWDPASNTFKVKAPDAPAAPAAPKKGGGA